MKDKTYGYLTCLDLGAYLLTKEFIDFFFLLLSCNIHSLMQQKTFNQVKSNKLNNKQTLKTKYFPLETC